jgi:hypothetical protein
MFQYLEDFYCPIWPYILIALLYFPLSIIYVFICLTYGSIDDIGKELSLLFHIGILCIGFLNSSLDIVYNFIPFSLMVYLTAWDIDSFFNYKVQEEGPFIEIAEGFPKILISRVRHLIYDLDLFYTNQWPLYDYSIKLYYYEKAFMKDDNYSYIWNLYLWIRNFFFYENFYTCNFFTINNWILKFYYFIKLIFILYIYIKINFIKKIYKNIYYKIYYPYIEFSNSQIDYLNNFIKFKETNIANYWKKKKENGISN